MWYVEKDQRGEPLIGGSQRACPSFQETSDVELAVRGGEMKCSNAHHSLLGRRCKFKNAVESYTQA